MTTDKATILKSRAENIRDVMLRAEKRGSDVHEMENIRHCAQGVVDLIGCDEAEAEKLEGMVSSLERRTVDFFKKRYPAPEPKRDDSTQ